MPFSAFDQVIFVISRSAQDDGFGISGKMMSNQGDTTSAKSANDACSGFADDAAEREIGIRLAAAVKGAGGNKVVATKSGIPLRTLARLLAGQEPKVEHLVRLAEVCGVSLDWLATGVGEMLRYPEGAKAPAAVSPATEITARLLQIHAYLNGENAAPTPEIEQELQRFIVDPAANEGDRAFADTLLNVAFGDRAVARRSDQRLKDVGAQLRGAKHLLETACTAVDWTPPRLIWHLLQSLIFRYAVELEDVVSLLGAMKDEVSRTEAEK